MNQLIREKSFTQRHDNEIYISHNGFEFNYSKNKWILNRNITLNISCLNFFDTPLNRDIRSTLLNFAINHSADHTNNILKSIIFYKKITNQSKFSIEGFISFKNLTPKKNWYRISILRTFIYQMKFLGFAQQIDPNLYPL